MPPTSNWWIVRKHPVAIHAQSTPKHSSGRGHRPLSGVGLAFFFEQLDNTVKTPDDVEQQLRLPSFGMVPEISCERKNGRLSIRKSSSSGKSYPVEMITFHSPRSLLSEAYRTFGPRFCSPFLSSRRRRSPLPARTPRREDHHPGQHRHLPFPDGRPRSDRRWDMRKPRIHKVFGNGNGTGLSNFLSGNAKLWSVIRRSEIQKRLLHPGRIYPPNPAELLGSNLFKDMIQALSERLITS